MKRILPGLLTLAVMGVVAWTGLRRHSEREGPQRQDVELSDPAEARLHSLLQSARDGDVAAYLAAFDEPIRARIEREIDEKGRDAFVAALRQAARSRKSRAVFAAVREGDDVASVVVEMVYPGHNERQTYRLCRKPEGWLVTDVTTARGQQPPSKLGAPATFQEPEGVPVQTAGFPDDVAASGEVNP
jgi:hypothetical protein